MAEDNSQFSYRPFSALQTSLPRNSKGEIEVSPISQEDRELFLREFWHVQPALKDKNSGFLLGEQCDLTQFSMKKKKSSSITPTILIQEKQPPQEEDIFVTAMRNTTPLGGKGRRVVPARRSKSAASMSFSAKDEDFASQLEFALKYSDEYLEGFVVGLDEIILNRLREGQFSPEAHLDLHGLNVEQAFASLQEFMRQAWFKGLRTVLIVHGRGRNSPAGMGILRQKLPHWLSHEPFKRLVLAFCTAKPHDGGPGSVYALLRKARKKGPVRWETLAYDSDVF